MTDAFEWEERAPEIPFYVHMIAGSCAGITEHCLLLPFDNVKTNAQVLRAKTSADIINIMKNIYRRGGIRRFWSGVSVMASGCVPAHAAYFSIFEFAKANLIDKTNKNIQPHIFALTGALSTVVHDCIITPFDVLKQRKQLLREPTFKILNDLIRKEGFFSLYRSLPITMSMNLPWASVLVGVNESLKKMTLEQKNHTFFTYFLCASFAASIASIITIPFDNVKTRLQTQTCYLKKCCNSNEFDFKTFRSMQNSFKYNSYKQLFYKSKIFCVGKISKQTFTTKKINEFKTNCIHSYDPIIKYQNVSETIKKIFHEEGMKGFFKGTFPRILGQAPSAATSWAAYETIKGFLINKNLNLH